MADREGSATRVVGAHVVSAVLVVVGVWLAVFGIVPLDAAETPRGATGVAMVVAGLTIALVGIVTSRRMLGKPILTPWLATPFVIFGTIAFLIFG